MMTVNEVSRLTGVSIRTLHYYDTIGLLKPAQMTESGYRLYDDTALERLQSILLFRELQFPLKKIRDILDSPDYDRTKALEQQITLLRMKKEHIENLIDLACGIKTIGVKPLMDFTAFDTRQIDEYANKAKAAWGTTKEYKEFEEKHKNRSVEEENVLCRKFMQLFTELGAMKKQNPTDDKVRKQIAKLHAFINENFYQCSLEILQSLGNAYGGGGSMTENIDKAGGAGTAEFAKKAITAYCEKG